MYSCIPSLLCLWTCNFQPGLQKELESPLALALPKQHSSRSSAQQRVSEPVHFKGLTLHHPFCRQKALAFVVCNYEVFLRSLQGVLPLFASVALSKATWRSLLYTSSRTSANITTQLECIVPSRVSRDLISAMRPPAQRPGVLSKLLKYIIQLLLSSEHKLSARYLFCRAAAAVAVLLQSSARVQPTALTF